MSTHQERCYLANLCCAYHSAFRSGIHAFESSFGGLSMQWILQLQRLGWAANDSQSEPDSMGCMKPTVDSVKHTLALLCIVVADIGIVLCILSWSCYV